MNRRQLLVSLAACSFATRRSMAQAAIATHADEPWAAVPAGFIGLSYESAQLANPDFFSPYNHALVAMFRELAPHGNLRIGGGSSEFTTFAEEADAPAPFEVFGLDTSKTVKTGTSRRLRFTAGTTHLPGRA